MTGRSPAGSGSGTAARRRGRPPRTESADLAMPRTDVFS